MRNPFYKLLGFLVFLANREGKQQTWYAVKNKILDRYGRNAGYDIQYLEGTECWSCEGTGYFKKYSFGSMYREPCYKCYNGWYKKPVCVLLERRQLGTYIFHKPIRREYKIADLQTIAVAPPSVTIYGYIHHTRAKYGWLALSILYWLFDAKDYYSRLKLWYGRGWRLCWWMPRNWAYNAVHLIRYKHKAIPFERYRAKRRKVKYVHAIPKEDLPF